MSLKFTGSLCAMAVKNYAKIEEKLTLMKFDLSTPKSQKFALQWAAFDQSI